MWTNLYDRHGRRVDGAWSIFRQALRTEHQPIVKIDFLDSSLNPVGDFIVSVGIEDVEGEVTNVVTDGNVDVDVERGTRRTAELTLLNPTAEFTPATEDFDPDGAWVGKIYLNRFVRIWRGVMAGGKELYVPVGTFMVDTCEVIVEQNMSLVNLTLSDFWKKTSKSYFGYNKKYPPDTPYNEIIRDLIDAAGVPLTGKYGAVLDRMPDRESEDKITNTGVSFKRGESRGDKLKELGKRWGLDIYFDPLGVFRTEDRREAKDKESVWTFASRAIGPEDQNGGLITLTRTFNDDNLYNHVIIVGTGNEKQVFKATRADNKPSSRTNIDTIGDRVFLLETDKVSNQAQADRALHNAWEKRFQIAEQVVCDVVCNPCLEADDVVRVRERDYAKVDGEYRLRRFNVPLVTTRQTIEVSNIIRGDDL